MDTYIKPSLTVIPCQTEASILCDSKTDHYNAPARPADDTTDDHGSFI